MSPRDRFDITKSCGYCPQCHEIVNVIWLDDATTYLDEHGIRRPRPAPACMHCAALISTDNFLGLKIGDV